MVKKPEYLYQRHQSTDQLLDVDPKYFSPLLTPRPKKKLYAQSFRNQIKKESIFYEGLDKRMQPSYFPNREYILKKTILMVPEIGKMTDRPPYKVAGRYMDRSFDFHGQMRDHRSQVFKKSAYPIAFGKMLPKQKDAKSILPMFMQDIRVIFRLLIGRKGRLGGWGCSLIILMRSTSRGI